MKILLSWLLDFIECKPAEIDVAKLVHLFNVKTAEIELFYKVDVDVSKIFVAQALSALPDTVELFCPELNQTFSLPRRSDLVVKKWYLITQHQGVYRWLLISDLNKEKEGIIPAVHVSEQDSAGAWKSSIFQSDWVFEVDNKSINHRPDLWGHYGIAREVAAFFNLKLTAVSNIVADHSVIKNLDGGQQDMVIDLQASGACKQFAATTCSHVTAQDSDIQVAFRLALVGAKPINAMVDLTNYVMFDLGHPMHVFDAKSFPDQKVVVRSAQEKEILVLLDGQTVKLGQDDLVIANSSAALSLAGIMGGRDSGYQNTTTSIILEAAAFDPVVIRKTAQKYKLRSEASMRFEKDLSPSLVVTVLQRFLFLAQKLQLISPDVSSPIIVAGHNMQEKTCTVEHDFIQRCLGMDIAVDFVIQSLTKLEFKVKYDATGRCYQITIPGHRATKDINIKEDIVEEIIRSFGFENIVPVLPVRQMKPFDMKSTNTIRSVKAQLAYGLGMHEVRDYMMYDASWISKFQVDLSSAVQVKSPLSENWTTLVTSLIPHLLKSVNSNLAQKDHLRFFEYGRIWSKLATGYQERKVLAGIIYDKDQLDFYTCKQELQSLWSVLGLNVLYKKPQEELPVWYDAYQTADLWHNNVRIARVGMMAQSWKHQVVGGTALIFEIEGDVLETMHRQQPRFTAWSKYQEVVYDISLLVPLTLAADRLKITIKNAHSNIIKVDIVDFFEKPEWKEHRSITLRYTMADDHKTMTKNDLDGIVHAVHAALKDLHVEIR